MCGHKPSTSTDIHKPVKAACWVTLNIAGTQSPGFSSPDAPYRDVLHPVQLGNVTIDSTTGLRKHALPRGISCLRQN